MAMKLLLNFCILLMMSYGICKPIHYEHEIEEEEDITDANKSFDYKYSELEREFLNKILDFEESPDENKTIHDEQQESFLLDVIAVFAITSLCLITLWVVVLYSYGYQCMGPRRQEKDVNVKDRNHPYRSTTPSYRSISSSNRSLLKPGSESPYIGRSTIIGKSDSAGSLVAL